MVQITAGQARGIEKAVSGMNDVHLVKLEEMGGVLKVTDTRTGDFVILDFYGVKE